MTTDTLDRVAGLPQRRWTRRLRAVRPWLIGAAAVVVVAFGVWVVLFSSWLGVRTVQVEGTTTTSPRQVTRAVDVPPGTPLARVDLGAVRARVEAIPTIASVSVARGWPHTLVVQVTERRPVADLFRDGSWWLVDESGVIYTTTPAPARDLPVVQLDGSPSRETLPEMAAVLRSLPADLLSRTSRVRAASMDSITLLLKDGRQVHWGSGAESSQKAAVLRVLLRTKATVIDVSVPSHPATHS